MASEQEIANLQAAFRLTATQAELVALLSDGKVHLSSAIMGALYGDAGARRQATLRMHVHNARQSLAGTGVWVERVQGKGYVLTGEAHVRDVMAGAPA